MAKKYEIGDVHAPVEDTEVPLGFKLLVIFMIVVLVGLSVLLTITANRLGLLNIMITPVSG